MNIYFSIVKPGHFGNLIFEIDFNQLIANFVVVYLVTFPSSGWRKRGCLIQTSVLFTCKYKIVNIRTT